MNLLWFLRFGVVLCSLIAGIWIPLRMIYFKDYIYLDIPLEIFVFAIVGVYPFIEKKYLDAKARVTNSWFSLLTDFVAAFPAVTIIYLTTGSDSNFFLLSKLLILRRLFWVRDLLDVFDQMHPVVFRLLPLAIYMPMLIHLVACGWITLGSGTAGADPDKLFEYIKAVYWAFTTLSTVGYGDIVAKTSSQMLFAAFTQLIGVGVFGFVLSNVASLLSRLDAAREHHMNTLDKVETYMRYSELPVELRTKVREYFNYIWESRKGYNDSSVLDEMPHKLRSEISLFMNRGIIEKVPLFKDAPEDVVEDIVCQLVPQVCIPGEKIFHIDEAGDAMYFIHSGTVEIIDREGRTLATLQPGSFFGEMALITSNARSASVRSMTYSDLFVLSRENFEKVIHRYPAFEEHMHEIAKERLAKGPTPKAS